jgi:hypothetical protein
MAFTDFPRLLGLRVNLRRLSVNDAERIAHLMSYNISVPDSIR